MKSAATCCFTGHRPSKLPWGTNEDDERCLRLKERLASEVQTAYDNGYRHFICGMARGADFYFCEAVLALRERHSDVTVEAALPCETQASRWPEKDRSRYFSLVAQCDVESVIQSHYDKGCMQRRDRYMVDHSSLLLAVYNGLLGGTMYTLTYAMRHGVETRVISLDEYEM
ncbi:MAG: DUF1273 domain-containing protein [Oscillospiraceae bacterium]|nr:DUF1273 domain-containing protein [Oscillospiraceae bacterium]